MKNRNQIHKKLVTGAVLRELRDKRKLSQAQAARLAGVSQMTISRWERRESLSRSAWGPLSGYLSALGIAA